MKERFFLASVLLAVFLGGCGTADKDGAKPQNSPVAQNEGKEGTLSSESPTNSPEPSSQSAEKPTPPASERPTMSAGGTTPAGGGSVASRPTSPAQGRPQRPPVPKADKTAGMVYESGRFKIEIEGVCKIDESSVACWNTRGERFPDLEERLKASLNGDESRGYGYVQNIQFQYGKKNRYIVVKTTQQTGSSDMGGYVNVESAGSNPFGGSYSSISLDRQRTGYAPNEPYVQYSVRFVAEDKAAKTTSVRLAQNDRADEQPSMDCKTGATLAFDGKTYKIASIKKGVHLPHGQPAFGSEFGGVKRESWTIEIVSTGGSSSRQMHIHFQPTDSSGKAILFADKDGNPVTQEEYQKEMTAQMDSRATASPTDGRPKVNPPKYFSGVSGLSTSQESEGKVRQIMVMYVNPNKVPSLRAQITRVTRIEMKGIPLDPK